MKVIALPQGMVQGRHGKLFWACLYLVLPTISYNYTSNDVFLTRLRCRFHRRVIHLRKLLRLCKSSNRRRFLPFPGPRLRLCTTKRIWPLAEPVRGERGATAP
ncbi:hypothetical protein TorRG33x02_049500 [Trema orientale]|uniref:Uncharacterized protein n=1 Tax=Trema orientale TaxID=63057 RepID=A0A2P5FNL1_TREOI|nr:hypothetical protein TorRG33x02_049500 [Trema orientale]